MAVAALQEAAHVQPLNGDIQRSLSEAYFANGLSKDAFQSASAALELSPLDISMLTWFINQGLQIASLPGASLPAIRSQVIQALGTALQQVPDRADLLIQLGSLLLLSGKKDEAIAVIKKLAFLDTTAQKICAASIYKLGLETMEAGESSLAADLYLKAIEAWKDQHPEGDPSAESISLADLFEALVKAFESLGDFESTLNAIEQALSLEQARASLHLGKAEILLKLDQNEAARQTLEAALERWPDNVYFYHALARAFRRLGDLPAALQQVETGIVVMQKTENHAIEKSLYNLAAKYAYATLRPQRAYVYFQKAVPAEDADYNRYENAIFRAELALEAGEIQAAAEAVDLFGEQVAETPRALAACGRLACRRGEKEIADKKCRSAVRLWTKLQQNQPGVVPASSPDEFMAELTSIGMAALENRQWEQALSIFRQMVVMFPDEPLANFKLMQALLICAEAQALCQDFEVVKRAPGKDYLLEAAYLQFEKYLQVAAQKVGSESTASPDGAINESDVEIKRAIGLFGCRGRACFIPVFENAAALEKFLQTMLPETADISALVMTFRRCGAKNRAIRAVKVGWQPVFEGRDPREEPEVLAQLALAEDDTNQAIKNAIASIAAAEKKGYVWPDLPMLHFLLANLQMQVADYSAAQQAIEKALNIWPDEPRWKALAAKIKMAAPASNQAQQLSEATGLLEQAVDLEPENGSHLLTLGKLYLQTNQTKRGLQAFEQAVRLSPADSEAWLSLARVQELRGDLEQAALSAEKAAETSEEPLEATCLRAKIAVKVGNHRAAMNWAQDILRSYPNHPEALHLLAQSLAGLDRPEAAIEAMDKAIELHDNPLSLQIERLELIKHVRGLETGLKALQELVAQHPKQASFLALLAGWLEEGGKKEAAVQAARLALQDGMEGLSLKQRSDLHIMIGLHTREQGQLDQSIHHLSEAVSLSSDYLDAYLELGKVYQERRETQQALKIYQKAIGVAGMDYRPYFQAGLVLKDNKDYMAAEAMLRRAAQLAPNEVSVHRMLGAVVALNLVHNRRLTREDPGI